MACDAETIHKFLCSKVCSDVVVEKIYPYARPSPHRELMRDIRSFSTDMSVLETISYTDGKPVILYNDLMSFLLNTDPPRYPNTMRFFRVLRRFGNKPDDISDATIRNVFRKMQYYGNDEDMLQRRSRQIIGMLTPEERTKFINQYILVDSDE